MEESRIDKIEQALKQRIEKGLERNFHDEPILKLKNGITLIIRQYLWFADNYIVEEDYGCTCKQLAYRVSLHDVAVLIAKIG